MIADVKVYKNCKIEYGKNFVVDSIEDYLSTLDSLEYDDFQYQKIQYLMNIKLNWHEATLEMISAQNYNYLSITNYEDGSTYQTRTYYFFILKKEWKAQNTVNFQIILDSINTFKPSVDFNINAKTHINREHKDRFTLKNFEKGFNIYGHCSLDGGSYVYQETFQSPNGCQVSNFTTSPDTPTPVGLVVTCTYTATTYTIRATYTSETDCIIPAILRYRGYERQIDTYAEGLNPILYKKDETYLETPDATSWNLLYKNNNPIVATEYNQVNAVSCYLVPDSHISVRTRDGSFFKIEASDLVDNVEYYITPYNNDLTFPNRRTIGFYAQVNADFLCGAWTGEYDTTKRYCVKLEKVGGLIKISKYWNRNYSSVLDLLEIRSGLSEVYVVTSLDTIYASNSSSNQSIQTYSFNNTNPVIRLLETSENIDKTDSKIVKIIKLPYAPLTFDVENGYFDVPPAWNFDSSTSWLKLVNLSASFINEIYSDYDPLNPLKAIPLNPAKTDVRNDANEPKQYMSEFYVNKAVYDSFNYPIELEKIQAPTPMDDFKLNFVTTKTINSRFLFDFKDIHYKFASQDYENIMTVARNNEVTIYSNQFINYLRTGYNYDVKAKERSELANRVGLITSVVGNVASLGLGALSGNVPVAISSTIGATSSIVNSIISNANAMAQNEANMEQKIAQYKAQATSVSGSDDLDLMIYYSKNLLKFAEYSCSNKIKASILDLFYYGGYATDEMKTPNVNTRAWFNFLSCELIADTISYIPEEILQDIIAKYSQGVTFLHKNIISSVPTWDFEQTKENWEVSIL